MKLETLKIGMIGFGNMAQALTRGWLGAGVLQGSQLYACARDREKLRRNTAALGIQACENLDSLLDSCEVLVLAVKPFMIESVLRPVLPRLEGRFLISLAAGWDFERFEALLPAGCHHISTIPNTPVAVGKGIFICEDRHSLSGEETALLEALLRPISLVQYLDTRLLGIGGVIGGCGPAFASMFMEALSDAAVMYGIPRAAAYELVSQMLAGTALLQLESGAHPGVMKDAVCSPSGTTIVGVAALEKAGLRSALIEAVRAIQTRP